MKRFPNNKSFKLFISCIVFTVMFSVLLFSQEKKNLHTEKIPESVLESLHKKFPNAVINKWDRENEDSLIIYDFEFMQDSLKLEADIGEDGIIHNWEKQIDTEELPELVGKTVKREYPEYKIIEAMQIMSVIDGENKLEGYELILLTPENKEVEISLAEDGTILEDANEDK